MTNRTHRNDRDLPLSSPVSEEGSAIRERMPAAPATDRKSDPNLSLDQRLERKLAEAAALRAKLEPQDARARLLQIALLRRDEALLDGILAELASPRSKPQPR